MKHANDNVDPFSRLPLFASDMEIAEAVVGKAAAKAWVRDRLPTLAGKAGFPPIDAFHGGRAVPLVRMFYQGYLGVTPGMVGKPDAEEGTWRSGRRR